MFVQIQILNQLGEFKGEVIEIDSLQYEDLCDRSKRFYDEGFEMDLDGGGFIIIPPDLIKNSVLKINKL